MTTQIKRRRGTTTQHASFTGAEGELTVDTTKDTVVVHDGSTAGGHPLAKASEAVAKSGDTMTGNLSFGDNDKAIFGAGSDLQIYYDGSNSLITDTGAGNLTLTGSSEVTIENAARSQYMFRATDGGSVQLYNAGAVKLDTTSTGIDVTGTVTADGLTVDGNAVISNGDTSVSSGDDFAKLQLKSVDSSTNSYGVMSEIADVALASFNGATNDHKLVIRTNDGLAATGTLRDRVAIDRNGDISFYEDQGTTPAFHWSAADERLGIGTTSPSSIIHSLHPTSPKLTLERDSTSLANNNVIGEIAMAHKDSNDAGTAVRIIGRAEGTAGAAGLAFNTGTPTSISEAMRIDSSGSVGIGTTAPAFPLDLSTNSSTTNDAVVVARISANTTGTAANNFGAALNFSGEDASGSLRDLATINAIYTNATNRSSALTFKTRENLGALTERMRIDSGGRVMINTQTEGVAGADELTVASPDNGSTGITIRSGATSAGSLFFSDGTSGAAEYDGGFEYHHQQGYMRFVTAGAEKMRLDSSGNLLVGTTDDTLYNNTSGSGIMLAASGRIDVARVQDVCAILNRTGVSDGSIMDFKKNGSTVGSIGTTGGDLLIYSTEASHGGLRFGQGYTFPVNNTGATSDGAIDLGASFGRFKDLYLSGGVYLGGTGAANKLDDYEEGTWTPSLKGADGNGGTTTYGGTPTGVYTKIGNLVTVSCVIYNTAHTGSGAAHVLGLPFACSSSGEAVGTYQVNTHSTAYASGITQVAAIIQSSNSHIHFRGFHTGTSAGPYYVPMQNFTYLRATITYYTNA